MVLFCHGNGEDVPRAGRSGCGSLHDRVSASVFAWDYRSYGRSEGIPHEDNVIADARVAQLKLAELARVDPETILFMGRSLGGAVSVALAAQHATRGLVLDRTFSTLVEAAAHNVPYLPVSWIMRKHLSRQSSASATTTDRSYKPTATEDAVVPLEQGRRLFEAAPSEQKKFLEIEGLNHNAHLPESCTDELIEFSSSGILEILCHEKTPRGTKSEPRAYLVQFVYF